MARKNKPMAGIQPPVLPADLSTPAPDWQPQDHEQYADLALDHLTLAEQEAHDITIERLRCTHVDLSGVRWPLCVLRDALFDTCELSGAAWDKPLLQRVELTGCRITGFSAVEGRIQHAVFRECSGAYAMFWATRFKAARFERCLLSDASFHGADLSGVVFYHCDLRNADFQEATLAGADLRGSQLAGARVGIQELQGAIIDPEQAAVLATLLGVVVQLA